MSGGLYYVTEIRRIIYPKRVWVEISGEPIRHLISGRWIEYGHAGDDGEMFARVWGYTVAPIQDIEEGVTKTLRARGYKYITAGRNSLTTMLHLWPILRVEREHMIDRDIRTVISGGL